MRNIVYTDDSNIELRIDTLQESKSLLLKLEDKMSGFSIEFIMDYEDTRDISNNLLTLFQKIQGF